MTPPRPMRTRSVTVNVLQNDTDADNDGLTVTGASALHGTVVVNADGTLTYTPDANYHGGDTITYTVNDGQEATSEGRGGCHGRFGERQSRGR